MTNTISSDKIFSSSAQYISRGGAKHLHGASDNP